MSTPSYLEPSDRVKRLPTYLFAQINAEAERLRSTGSDIIDLGMGNPADPTPERIVERLRSEALNPANHRYSNPRGILELREAVAERYARKHGVTLDPQTEVIACIGSKEGLSHFSLAMLQQGDTVIVGDPAYPIHIYGPQLAGANVIRIPLGNDGDFLDRIESLITSIKPKPKMFLLCYPHNPTTMTIGDGFFEQAVAIGQRHGVAIVHDLAYADLCFDGYEAPSFLSTSGAKELGVEFMSMSKAYNMAGWRVGFCCGNAQMVQSLATIKGYYEYGIFQAIQLAAITALRECDDDVAKQRDIYVQRRDTVLAGLKRLGWTAEVPKAGMFVWANIAPEHLAGSGTIDFVFRMLREAGVGFAPGQGFGDHGEGAVRIALIADDARITQAFDRLHDVLVAKVAS